MSSPKVSVIIPTYNRANYICEAIDSVLNQTYQDFEIIVVDDGSTDKTEEIVIRYIKEYLDRIKYFYQENKGEPGARNRGIKEANGEYIAFIDSDDIWLKDKLLKQINSLETTNSDLVYCSMFIKENGRILWDKIKPSSPALNFHDLLLTKKSIPMTVLVKKQCLEKIGFFDESIKLACDYEMWLRFSLMYKIGYLNEPLGIYRQHSDNISNDTESMRLYGIKIYQKLLQYNINKKLLKKKLANEYYRLGKIYYEKRKNKLALTNIVTAVKNDPLVGLSFINDGEKLRLKLIKLIKPYFAILLILGFKKPIK